MRVSLIVAASENGCIGRDGDLPWRLPEDLKRFKLLTLGHPIIMGRKTYESIGRPLPGRENIVVTRQLGYPAPGCIVVGSLQEAINTAAESGAVEAFVIGGASLYAEALPLAHTLQLTRVRADVAGDVHLPAIPWHAFRCVAREAHPADERHAHAFTFEVWQREEAGRDLDAKPASKV